jgi:integrase
MSWWASVRTAGPPSLRRHRALPEADHTVRGQLQGPVGPIPARASRDAHLQRGRGDRHPCSRRTSPGTGKQRPYVATTEQVWALHNAVPAGIRPAILLGAHAGLRLAETAALRPEDVDFIGGVVSPTIQWPNEPLKSDTNKTRIPIPNELSLELSAAVARGRGLTIVTAEDGRPIALGHRANCTRRKNQGGGSTRPVQVPRPSALLRVATDRLGP